MSIHASLPRKEKAPASRAGLLLTQVLALPTQCLGDWGAEYGARTDET
jgi:hypothetical protein